MKQRVDDAIIGMENPLEVYSELVKLEKDIAQWKESLLEPALSEFEKHGSKEIVAFGCRISTTSAGRYIYDEYQPWVDKKEELKDIETKMQMGWKLKQPFVDSQTGEEIPMAKYNPNKTGLSFKFAK